MAKKTKGRQKIQMAKIENEINLQVTFSKRRSGLFKKASDLCILCGVEIAIVVFSPSKKAFCFGHPSVEMIADRFLKEQVDLPTTPQQQLMQAHQNASMYELNTQLTYLESQLEDAKTKRAELAKIRNEELAKIRNERIMKKNPDWYDAPIESMGLQDLECLVWVLEYLKGEIDEKKKKVTNPVQMAGPGSSTTIYGLDQFTVTPHGLVLGNGHSGPWSSQDVDWSILGCF